MNGYQFMSDSPFLTFFLALIVAEIITRPIVAWMRHKTIREKGYPPIYCDAEGDKKED